MSLQLTSHLTPRLAFAKLPPRKDTLPAQVQSARGHPSLSGSKPIPPALPSCQPMTGKQEAHGVRNGEKGALLHGGINGT